ncbi:hypothetical protein [Ascidiimonas sp. W6]|uniref:hypothetical protein n=1 Tax=Ascidiimonas meishanensis TaxID=3128903 RepID=UPI0030EB5D80
MKCSLKNRILLLTLVLIFASCSSSDDSDVTAPIDSQEVITTVQSGSWRITSFIDSGVDETDDFSGYIFTFNSDGSLSAVNGAITINGTWSVEDDDSTSDIDFNIFFASPPDFEELTEDWDIISRSTTQIQLTDVSGGNGDTDFLTFQKN